MSVLNCEAALFALEHADVFAAQAVELVRPAHRAHRGLACHAGHRKVWDSEANMVLVRVGRWQDL